MTKVKIEPFDSPRRQNVEEERNSFGFSRFYELGESYDIDYRSDDNKAAVIGLPACDGR